MKKFIVFLDTFIKFLENKDQFGFDDNMVVMLFARCYRLAGFPPKDSHIILDYTEEFKYFRKNPLDDPNTTILWKDVDRYFLKCMHENTPKDLLEAPVKVGHVTWNSIKKSSNALTAAEIKKLPYLIMHSRPGLSAPYLWEGYTYNFFTDAVKQGYWVVYEAYNRQGIEYGYRKCKPTYLPIKDSIMLMHNPKFKPTL